MCIITLLKLNNADKALIIYLYLCFVAWIMTVVYKNDKLKKEVKPNNVIHTNIFVSIKILFNGIDKRKLISDDNTLHPGDPNEKNPRLLLPIKKYRLNCSKIEFIRAVIRWCIQNLDYNKKRAINLDLKYSSHKTIMGSYNYFTKTITIYFASHKSIESLVDTIIHEHYHATEIVNKKHQIEYDNLTKEKTYYNNPFEVRARKAAADNRLKCILDMCRLNYLK